jgi:peptide/nickel transport system substrate-binding protein
VVVALTAGACGKGPGDAEATKPKVVDGVGVESGLADAGDPVRGGRIVYALESENPGGFCLPEARLSPAGNMVRHAIYDSLTMFDENAVPKPYLAESVTPDESYSRWEVRMRENVTFHDGTALDAEIVKDNIDAYLGRFEPREPALFPIVLENIDEVEVLDPRTVEITTKEPWVALPTYLARISIMARAQLTDPDNCATNLIGTGPFAFADWTLNRNLLAQRNADYWQIAPDGEPYPYADAIEFRPIVENQQRINALETGQVNAMQITDADTIYGPLSDLEAEGAVSLLVSNAYAEVSHVLLNNAKAPFDDERMRKAAAHGLDRDKFIELTGGTAERADQPFNEGDMGYVDDPGFPQYDPEEAKRLVAEYEAEGKKAAFQLSVVSEPAALGRAEIIQSQLKEVGIEVTMRTADQATLINEALGGNYEALMWKQHGGGDADDGYIWWHSPPNLTNLARVDDPVIDDALERGRVERDPALRNQIYQTIATQFGAKVYNIWLTRTALGVALAPKVHGVLAVDLPDGGGKQFPGLHVGHVTHGMWISN